MQEANVIWWVIGLPPSQAVWFRKITFFFLFRLHLVYLSKGTIRSQDLQGYYGTWVLLQPRYTPHREYFIRSTIWMTVPNSVYNEMFMPLHFHTKGISPYPPPGPWNIYISLQFFKLSSTTVPSFGLLSLPSSFPWLPVQRCHFSSARSPCCGCHRGGGTIRLVEKNAWLMEGAVSPISTSVSTCDRIPQKTRYTQRTMWKTGKRKGISKVTSWNLSKCISLLLLTI